VRVWRQACNPGAPAAMEQSDELAAALRQIGGGQPPPVANSLRARTPTPAFAAVSKACGTALRALLPLVRGGHAEVTADALAYRVRQLRPRGPPVPVA
jgi:hypothetical protein